LLYGLFRGLGDSVYYTGLVYVYIRRNLRRLLLCDSKANALLGGGFTYLCSNPRLSTDSSLSHIPSDRHRGQA
jgi:hypothetical protein